MQTNNDLVGKVLEGTCRTFNLRRGYGFIVSKEPRRDWFFHHSQIISDDKIKGLLIGELVSFTVGQNSVGLCATKIISKATDWTKLKQSFSINASILEMKGAEEGGGQ
jgi:cold shock CspA family protein